jgi:glycosyltransferase involved in cell wall biosynthesis
MMLNPTQHNAWKDPVGGMKVILEVAERLPEHKVVMLCLGDSDRTVDQGRIKIIYRRRERDRSRISMLYQVSDVYLHSTKADTYPSTILESLACGTPVVSNNVGGIPEQIIDGTTGYLIPSGNQDTMKERLRILLVDDSLRRTMSANAAEYALLHFGFETQIDSYLSYYEVVIGEWNSSRQSSLSLRRNGNEKKRDAF